MTGHGANGKIHNFFTLWRLIRFAILRMEVLTYPMRGLPRLTCNDCSPIPARREHISIAAGFSLSELMVATSVFSICALISMGVLVATFRSTDHAEHVTESNEQLRFLTDLISDRVRSSPTLPLVQEDGRELQVNLPVTAISNKGPRIVGGNMSYSPPGGPQGWRPNQRTLQISPDIPSDEVEGPGVTESIFTGSENLPSGQIQSASSGNLRTLPNGQTAFNLDDILIEGMTFTIAADPPYTPQAISVILRNVSNNPGGFKTIIIDGPGDQNNLGSWVMNGNHLILPTISHEVRFRVELNGDLRYYHNPHNANDFRVIARDINPTPLDADGNPTRPFVAGANNREIRFTFEHLPQGRYSGRTVQTVRTRAYARTDPSLVD